MNARTASHAVISSNIANASTANYRAAIPSFQIHLDQAASMIQGGEILSGDKPQWKLEMKVARSTDALKENGNNVQMEKEMSALTDNSLQYMSALKLLNKEMAITRYAIASR